MAEFLKLKNINSLILVLIFSFLVKSGFCSNNVKSSLPNISKSEIKTEHLVEAKLLYDELYDINISEGHYRVSVELLLSWEDTKTKEFLDKFGDDIIHGKKLDNYLNTIWYPEYFISNAENPRITHYKTLDVFEGKFELFERFEADLSISADMPKYPFGDLDLYLDLASFSGNKSKMIFVPTSIDIGHHDADHKVVKGNWKVVKTFLEENGRTSLNHGGKEKFSYLISHVKVNHGFIDALQKILFPLLSIVLISLIINHFFPLKHENSVNYRVGGQLTLFLTIPALKFALSKDLPSTHYLNLTDALFIWATLVVTFNMVISIISNYYKSESNNDTTSFIENNMAKKISPIFSVSVLAVIYFHFFFRI